jgi:hypothetical protein
MWVSRIESVKLAGVEKKLNIFILCFDLTSQQVLLMKITRELSLLLTLAKRPLDFIWIDGETLPSNACHSPEELREPFSHNCFDPRTVRALLHDPTF